MPVPVAEPAPSPTITLTIGYAWRALRDHVTETVGKRARAILEDAFLCGVVKGGDRRSAFQMEEMLAARLPVEERVSRYTCQTWLSARVKRQKQMNDPKFVYKDAAERERKRLLVEAWGFDTSSMTKDDLIEKLVDDLGCTVRNKNNRTGDFVRSVSKKNLLSILYSKLQAPVPFTNVDDFIQHVEARSKQAGARAVRSMTNVEGTPSVSVFVCRASDTHAPTPTPAPTSTPLSTPAPTHAHSHPHSHPHTHAYTYTHPFDYSINPNVWLRSHLKIVPANRRSTSISTHTRAHAPIHISPISQPEFSTVVLGSRLSQRTA